MDRIPTSYDRAANFLQAVGQLSEEDVLLLEEENHLTSVRGTVGEISTLFRTKSYFSIGEMIVLPLVPLLKARGEDLPADIQVQVQQYEFYQVQLVCSFQAAPHCRFHNAHFSVALETITAGTTTQTVSEKAIAYDLFPLKTEDERKVSVKQSFVPETKFSFNPVLSSLSLPLYDRTEEYVSYTSRIEAFDVQGSQPSWSFTRTSSHEISGPYKLFMLVRKPIGTQVKAVFHLTVQIQFTLGNIVLAPYPLVMIFRRQGSQNIITEVLSVPLC